MHSMHPRPLLLIIRDGWGENPNPDHDRFNAIRLARTPVDDRLRRDWPFTLIRTSGEDVGLPAGTMGNSEVGHQNIGAGRVVDQESVRISKACRSGEIRRNPALVRAMLITKERRSTLHLMGIASEAGVHGLLSHLYALVSMARELDLPRVVIHLFTDGRDTGPFTGLDFVRDVQRKVAEIGIGEIGSVIGRYWAMDRDNRWERVHRAWACLTGRDADAQGVEYAASPEEAVQRYYQHPSHPSQQGDEFIPPTMIGSTPQERDSRRIRDHDAVIYYNYRGDRPRQLVSAFVLPEFENADHIKPSPDTGRRGFDRGPKLDVHFVMMTPSSVHLAEYADVAFPRPDRMKHIAGEYLSSLGLTQFRCAETEKYPHVTFFFNDYRDEPFPGERRENPQSPKVATYDLKPEMSAPEVRDAVLRRLDAPDCEDFFVVNFANGDMVGHTGNLRATVRAIEAVDECVGAIVDRTLARGGLLIITADHGNAEQMWDPETNAPHTAHTTYDVPLSVVGEGLQGRTLRAGGRLADILPTALRMMNVEQPPEMTGRSLLT